MARIGYISLHTSPLDSPGSRDAGGMNVVEVEHARALAAVGHHVEIVTRRDDPQSPDVVELAPGVTVRRIPAGPAEPLAKSAQEAHIGAFSEVLAECEPYDLVHSHHWMSGVAALPVARAWGVPHVQSFHSVAALPGRDLGEGEPPESSGRNEGERVIARESDLVVAVSEYEARTIIERCGANPAQVTVVHPGVDSSVFFPSTEDSPAPVLPCTMSPAGELSPNGYVLFAARLQPLKGPDLALQTIALLPEEERPDLVMTGDVSQDFRDYRRTLDEMCVSLGISQKIRWCGPQTRDGLATLMRGARLMLVPSFSETFGLVALEANASGIPVVASDAGGLGEAIADGRTGVLLKSREPEAWAAATHDLVSDDERRTAMGRAGRERALEMSWTAGAEKLDGIYRALLSEPTSPGEQR